MLITLQSGFRGGFSRVEAVGAEILSQNSSGGHCVVTGHLVVRLTHPNGFIYSETGRRCSNGTVEVFSWHDYKTMPTAEFEEWLQTHSPDTAKNGDGNALTKECTAAMAVLKTLQQEERRKAGEKAIAERLSREAKTNGLGKRIEQLNAQRQEHGLAIIQMYDSYFESGWQQQLYDERAVIFIEKATASLIATAIKEKEAKQKQLQAVAEFKSSFEALEAQLEKFSAMLNFSDQHVELYEGGRYCLRCSYDKEGVGSLTS